MTSVDTNILLYANDSLCPEHKAASEFIILQEASDQFAICELVLMELYVLLRNPAVLTKPLSPMAATTLCETYRQNPHWKIIDHPGGTSNVMDEVWRTAKQPNFPRRAIFDARLALALKHHGITKFATRNTIHFSGFGFTRVWDPIGDR